MVKFEGKIALVAGASSSIGEATARRPVAFGQHFASAPRRVKRLFVLPGEGRAAGGKVARSPRGS